MRLMGEGHWPVTPTRDKFVPGRQIDTGVGSPPAERPNVWEPPLTLVGIDTGVGSPVAGRPDAFDGEGGAGHAIPPLWL